MLIIDRLTARYTVYENTLVYLSGIILLYLSIAFLLPLAAALYLGEDALMFVVPMVGCFAVSLPLLLFFKASDNVRPVEGIFLVSGAWIVAMFAGCVPYVMAGMGFLDACFESMSGFTTTGATIMSDIESWPASLLLWRSFTQWLGGAGIIIVFVTILPLLGIGGRTLFKNEFPGMEIQNFTLRVREAAKEFHLIYIILSLCLLGLVLAAGAGLYDAMCLVFSTMATGGFSPHSGSIGHFSPAIQWIVVAFMFLAATNFYLHYRALYRREPRAYMESTEFRGFALIVVMVTVFTFLALSSQNGGLHALGGQEETLRHSAFHVVSAVTSSGFAVDDYTAWPVMVQLLLLVIFLVGACSASTASGLKTGRAVMALKYLYHGLLRQVHPRAVMSLKMDGKSVSNDALEITIAMILLFICTLIGVTFILLATGVPMTEAFSATAACISNHGPGMGAVGPYGDYGWLDPLAKVALIFTMWAGRLELLTVFILLTPAFWREFNRYSHRGRGRRR